MSTDNKYINSKNGALTTPSSGSGWHATNYISVVGGRTYYFDEANASATTAGSAWYDENKTYISGFSATALSSTGNKYQAPANAKYLRHSFTTANNPDWEDTVMIYEGTTAQAPSFSKTGLAANTVQTFNVYYNWPLGTTAETPISTSDNKELKINYKITCKQAEH